MHMKSVWFLLGSSVPVQDLPLQELAWFVQESRNCQAGWHFIALLLCSCLATLYSHQPRLLHTTCTVSISSPAEVEEQAPRRWPVADIGSAAAQAGYSVSRFQETALRMEFLWGISTGQLLGFAEAAQGSHTLIFNFRESKLFLYVSWPMLSPSSSYQLYIWLLVVFISDKRSLAKKKRDFSIQKSLR